MVSSTSAMRQAAVGKYAHTLHPSLLRGGRRHLIRRAIPHGFKTSFEHRCQCRIYFVMHIIVLALEASRRPVGRSCTQ
jgi:hypothetical protein